jgi:murein DD-endopeptidase MepM/ murein hydrolase activator NlpD
MRFRFLMPFVLVVTVTACATQSGPQEPVQAAAEPAVKPVVERFIPVSTPAAATAPAMSFRGVLMQGGLMVGSVEPGTRIFLGERELRVGADGTVVFGLDRDAPARIQLRVARTDGIGFTSSYNVKQREYAIQRVTGISERVMNPSAEDEKRIAEEAQQASAARQRDDDRMDFRQKFIWPATGPITGVYGSQRYYNDVPKRPHYGVDVGIPVGTDVVAPAAGVVTLAHPDMFYSGGTLIIDHGYGVSSTLMHLSQVLVKAGDRVEQGQRVARSGASGRVSGPHLDWRMNWFDQRIDPQQFVPPMSAAAK